VAELKGRKLILEVRGGTFDQDPEKAAFAHAGTLELGSRPKSVVVRGFRLDASTDSLTASVAGRKMMLARLGGATFKRDGFDVRLRARRLLLTRAAAARLNRLLDLANVLRPGHSLGSVNGLAEPGGVRIDFGTFALGGPETTFSKLESLGVQMGIWGASERWGQEIGEPYFLFPVQPTTVGTDASGGILESEPNSGATMQIYGSPPREMLLRDPLIDLGAHELSAKLSALSADDPGVTGAIATLDYSTAKFQIRPKVGAFELMGIRAIANQFIADQLNARFDTPGMFQAGEVLARVTVTLHAPSAG
jgi:hypothetical protein